MKYILYVCIALNTGFVLNSAQESQPNERGPHNPQALTLQERLLLNPEQPKELLLLHKDTVARGVFTKDIAKQFLRNSLSKPSQ